MCQLCVLYIGLMGRFTGRATDSDVASRAAIRVMKQRLANAAMNRHPGLNASSTGSEVGEGMSSVELEAPIGVGAAWSLSDGSED